MCFVVEEAVQISAPFWCRFPRHFGADFRAILAHISKPTSMIFFPQNITQKNFSRHLIRFYRFTHIHLIRFTFYPNTNFSLNLIHYFIIYITPYTQHITSYICDTSHPHSLSHHFIYPPYSFHLSHITNFSAYLIHFHITYHIFYT